MANRYVQILDTTLRDGEQTQGVAFSPDEKITIARTLLEAVRVDRIEVASARVSEGEQLAVTGILDWAASAGLADRVEVLGFVDQCRSVDWIRSTGGQVINLLAKGSEKHCVRQLKKTLAQHLEDIRATIDYAQTQGLMVNMYLEDWSNGYQDSPGYVFDLMDGLQGAGIRHFMLPDTLGVLTPEKVYASLSDMIRRYPGCLFDFHPHNDYGLGTANVMAAARAGVSTVHCTVNCLGERAGNASLAEVVVNLRDQMGLELGVDESHLARVSELVEYCSGKRVAENAPVVGADVFTQTAGIHADGDSKGSLYQTRLRPERFGRHRKYALGKMSGHASLLKNMERLDISLSPKDQEKVLRRIVELGDSKKVITTEDLPFIIAEVLESQEVNRVNLLNCSVTSSFDLESTASIKMEIEGEHFLATGSGNGGFDAFMNAVGRIMKKQGVHLPELVDFEVRIPKGGRTDALTECLITWQRESGGFKTRGLHSNQVFAAVNATLRMLNILYHKQQQPFVGNDAGSRSAGVGEG